MKELLEKVIRDNREYIKFGKVASYIPELAKANKNALGICITDVHGREICAGNYDVKFTIQSISKVITLIIALMDNGEEKVFSKVGVEPTADPFNSIIDLELKNANKPLNPMINAGAIAIVSLIDGKNSDEIFNKILSFTRKLADNYEININETVYKCEKVTGNRNRSLAYFMKSTGVITKNVDEVLDVYFKQCSVEITCRDISKIASVLANDGVMPWNGERIIPKHITKIVKSIMVTCGMYDGSGEFAVQIGVPAKSGVGGGIMAAVPNKMGIGVFGPSLDSKGNSIAGIKVLTDLSNELDLSIF